MTHFVKDLHGYYGMLVVQPATLKETEWFHGMPIEAILENSEQPTGGLLRIDVHVRNNELETFYQRNGDYWVNAGRFFISDCNLEGDSAVVNRDVLSEMARMVVEDRDSVKKLWAKQRQGWESLEDPSKLRQPVAEPDGEDPPPQKDVDGS
jgi:hypothetical protein